MRWKVSHKRFEAEAEKTGLTCVLCGAYGWNTTPGDNLVEYALEKGWSEITLGRSTFPQIRTEAAGTPQAGAGSKRPSSTRKLVCPCCGLSVRATKTVNILCGDCMQKMEEVG